ncbi:Esterase lipase [Mycena chlorophos]|uniref:Esterase lipase n=1 Tax=Mycena chlorophos TaxID=658473 RepID=A0A8H6TW96_MYCCL|nr:Esterase lipase [Mycena chlorophos]
MNVHLDIAYAGDADVSRSFDAYFPSNPAPPVLVFVRGGAWRADDKKAHRLLATKLVEATGCRVLVPNYRLTTADNGLQHPGHAEDILSFLNFLVTWDDIPDLSGGVFLLGHSAGAHILSAIFLDSSAVTPTLTPSPVLAGLVRGLVLSEGIYDIDLLLQRFPTYRDWFIAPAFGDHQSYASVSVSNLPLRSAVTELKWLVVHSTGDTLVDLPQSQVMVGHLRTLYGDSRVQSSLDVIAVEHDDVPTDAGFIDLVAKFVGS